MEFLKYVCLTKIQLLYKQPKDCEPQVLYYFVINDIPILPRWCPIFICKWMMQIEWSLGSTKPLAYSKEKNFFSESWVICMLNFTC